MIRTLIIILLFSLLQTAAAEDTMPEQKSAGNDIKTRQSPSPWPLPFTPSQEVGADSQVAFPTDI